MPPSAMVVGPLDGPFGESGWFDSATRTLPAASTYLGNCCSAPVDTAAAVTTSTSTANLAALVITRHILQPQELSAKIPLPTTAVNGETMNSRKTRPARDEAAEYYFNYIDLVPPDDICAVLERQLDSTLMFLRGIPDARGQHRYAPGKWSISGVVAHINDCERLFAFRAFWFARGFDSQLPSFDQHIAARHDGADDRTLASHIEEFESVRRASLELFSHLPEEAWSRRGIASDNPFTVRALAFLAAGHVIHHGNILREQYLQ